MLIGTAIKQTNIENLTRAIKNPSWFEANQLLFTKRGRRADLTAQIQVAARWRRSSPTPKTTRLRRVVYFVCK